MFLAVGAENPAFSRVCTSSGVTGWEVKLRTLFLLNITDKASLADTATLFGLLLQENAGAETNSSKAMRKDKYLCFMWFCCALFL